MIKLNLASGQRPFQKPWINIDIKDQGYSVDILTDINNLSTFEDESVDVIVLHHVVEHIAVHDLQGYVNEWRRVLKKGGRMAVFVPNLRELDKAWIEGRITTFIHNINTYGAYQDSVHDIHKWGYDKEELINRISAKNEQTGELGFMWESISDIVPHAMHDVYKDADLAFDWWILALEFTK